MGDEERRPSLHQRGSGLQVPGMPRPGKTTQGHDPKRSTEPRKSFGTVRNFWRQLEGAVGPEPKRVPGRRIQRPLGPAREQVNLRHLEKEPAEQQPQQRLSSHRRPPLAHRGPSVTQREPAVSHRKPSVTQREPSMTQREPAVSHREPSESHREPAVSHRKPSVSHKEPSMSHRESAVSHREPAVSQREPAVSERKPSLPRKESEKKQPSLRLEAQKLEALLHPDAAKLQSMHEPESPFHPNEEIRPSQTSRKSKTSAEVEKRSTLRTSQHHVPAIEISPPEDEGSLDSVHVETERQHGSASPMLPTLSETEEEDEPASETWEGDGGLAELFGESEEEVGRARLPLRASATSRASQGSQHRKRTSGVEPPPPPPLPLPPPAFRPPSLFLGAHQVREDVELKRPSIFLPILLEEEKHFHELVGSGDLSGVQDFLEKRPDFNINCVNHEGVSGLHIAVGRGDEEMTEYLLAHPELELGDAHLFAIRDGRPVILRLLLDRLQATDPALEFMACTGSAEFSETLTPLILAAESGHYDVINMLLDRGHRIPVPHPPWCYCKEECQLLQKTQDPLTLSSGKLHIYRALSNPAYICQTSQDPILTAFLLSRELMACGYADLVYLRQYQDLAEAVRLFAVDLIAECRNVDEVEMILSETQGSSLKYIYPRLIMAVDYKQKEFVAHPNVQHVLERTWSGDWLAWRGYRKYIKALYVFPRILMLPVILGVLMFTPTSAWAKHYALPINKFLSTIASYIIFMLLIFVQSNVVKTKQTRDTKPTGVEVFIAIYVVTFMYNTVRSILIEGPKKFFSFMWNIYEVLMEILFMATFVFWIVAAIRTTVTGEKDVERKYWDSMDPELIAEGLFVIASIMAYLKVLLICQVSYDLGPLQVSLGKMTNDCAMYSIIFAIILLAFTVGLCRFYSYYDGMYQKNEETGEIDSKQENSFTSFHETFKTLFWGLFGMSSFEVADVVIEPITNDKGETTVNEHHFTETIGYITFAVYMVLTVIVILNMLIATMSTTFQSVTDNVETEWAFGRTEVKLSYINLPVLPPPFNVIPTTNGMVNLFKGAKKTAVRLSRTDVEKGLMEDKRAEEYSMLISQLVQRYFSTKSEQ